MLILIGLLFVELQWSPRIEITREKDIYLFYTKKAERIPIYLFTL